MGWPAILDTSRLRLRPPRLDDAPAITAYAGDAEVVRYVSWRRHRGPDEAHEFLGQAIGAVAAGREVQWAITPPTSDTLLGMIGLRLDGHRVELGYVLARPSWGQGFATEAARAVVDCALGEPAVFRVWAVCAVENVASARVLEKAGLEREGRLSRWAVFPNLGEEPRDCWCYARAR